MKQILNFVFQNIIPVISQDALDGKRNLLKIIICSITFLMSFKISLKNIFLNNILCSMQTYNKSSSKKRKLYLYFVLFDNYFFPVRQISLKCQKIMWNVLLWLLAELFQHFRPVISQQRTSQMSRLYLML